MGWDGMADAVGVQVLTPDLVGTYRAAQLEAQSKDGSFGYFPLFIPRKSLWAPAALTYDLTLASLNTKPNLR
jgi:hypothetical protein